MPPDENSNLPACGIEEEVLVYNAESRLRQPDRFFGDFLQDLRASRGAVRALLMRNLAQRYRYSSLGLLWVVFPPVVTAAAIVIGQKSSIFDVGANALYAVFGVMMAQTFLESINLLRGLFVSNRQMLARDNTPLEAFTGSSLLEESFHTVLRLGIVVMPIIFSMQVSFPSVALVVPGFLGVMLAGAGIGLLLAPLSALKGDWDKAMGVFPWIFFAVTPVFFHGGNLGLLQKVYAVNPAAWVFDSIRNAAYGSPGSLWPALFVFPAGLLLCLVGMLWCRLARPHVMERAVH